MKNKNLITVCIVATALGISSIVFGAQVGPSGYTTGFDTLPSVSDWATYSYAGAGGDEYDLTATVQTLSINTINNPLIDSGAADPPSANSLAIWGANGFICTRPTGNRFSVIAGIFQNTSGTNASSVKIEYDFDIKSQFSEPDYPGHRAFYSLTGEPGSWNPIPELSSSTPTPGKLTAIVNLTTQWNQNSYLYVIWVDDNASAMNIDPAYTIDNFSIKVDSGTPITPPINVSVLSPTNNAFFYVSDTITIEANATSRDGNITNVSFFVDDLKIGDITESPYKITWQNPAAGIHTVYATAADDKRNTTNSTPVLIAVFDLNNTPVVKIIYPKDGDSFEGPTNILIKAIAFAPAGISNVQIFANETLLIGSDETPPYEVIWNAQFGSNIIKAIAIDPINNFAISTPINIYVSEPPINTNPPVIISVEPQRDSIVGALTQIKIIFSEPVINVDASDLLINGKPAKSVIGSGAQYTFSFDQPPYGTVTISWANNHGITDIGYPTNLPFDGSAPGSVWTYQLVDRDPPVVIRRFPSAGSQVSELTQITIIFNEPVTGVDAEDLLINGILATEVTGSGTTYTFTFQNPPATDYGADLIYISFSENSGITDLAETPNALDPNGAGSKWAYRRITAVQTGNDNFDNRIAITNLPATIVGYNVGATTEAGEPTGSGFFRRGASVWWKWVAPFSGTARIDTFNSSFNTTLGVFTGTNVSSLTQVAFNDNAGGTQQSLVTFNAVAGTEYQIQVCGAPSPFTPATGVIFLNVSMPPVVNLVSPTNNSLIIGGEPTTLSANAAAVVGSIMQVDFYARDTYLGTALKEPYTITVTNIPPGSNSVYALATDTFSQTSTAGVNVLVLNYGVTITAPADGAYFNSTNTVPITAIPYLPTNTGTITNIAFYVDDVLIGEDSTSPFSITWTNASPGSHRLTAVGYADTGVSYKSAPVYIGVIMPIIPVGAIWKYLDNGTDQGIAWKEPGFDDSTWQAGPSPLGYGDANGSFPATTNSYGPDPSNKFVTTYYRMAFDYSEITKFEYIYLLFQRDDGIIIYLNGNEIYRQNMPSGAVYYNTYANSPVGGQDEAAWYGIGLSPSMLLPGRNVIAVEVHQSDPQSSDLWFNLQLIGYPLIVRNQFPAVALTNPTNNAVFIAPAQIQLNAVSSDADGTVINVEFYDGTAKLSEDAEEPYQFIWQNPSVGWHELRAAATDDRGATQLSDPVNITIYATENTPLVQITSPSNGRVYDNLEGYTNVTIKAKASAFYGVSNVVFMSDSLPVGVIDTPPYTLVWSNVPFGSHQLTAIVYDINGNSATSAPVAITVVEPPINTQAPTIVSVNPPPGSTITNLTTIQITFSERVMGIDASDLLINGTPALQMTGSGSNYIFTVAQPPYGTVTISWAKNHGITDKGYPENLPFDETAPGATWTYNLIDKLAPYIVSRSPAPWASVNALTQIIITFNERVNGVDANDLLINGSPAAQVTTSDNITYTFAFPRPLYGTVTVEWAAEHGIVDTAVEPNAFVPSGTSLRWQYILLAPRVTLVPTNAIYKLLKGLWEPSSPVSLWRTLTYDDAIWLSAQAPFYFDIDRTPVPFYGNTQLNDMYNNYQVIYLRHKFYVSSPQALTNLTIRSRCDDGFIAWINGVEVFRSSTVPAGEVLFNYASNYVTSASESASGLAFVTNIIAVPSSVLVAGQNILAIQAMNTASNSSDFMIDVEIYASAVDPMLIAPSIASVTPTPGDVWALTNITIQFTEPVANVTASALLINGDPATNLIQLDDVTYTFEFSQPAYGQVNVSWAESHNIVDFDATPKPFSATNGGATFQYRLLNPALPRVVDISPKPGLVTNYLTDVTVTFDRDITNITAGDLLINGVAATVVSGEYSNYTFAFTQPAYGTVNISWAPSQRIADANSTDLIFDPTLPGNTWKYLLLDRIAPTVVTQNPPAGAYISNLTYVIVVFSEPVKGVNASDLLLNGTPATSILGSGTTYRFGFPSVNATNIVITWAPDHGITDQALMPNAFDANDPGATWSYMTEDRVAPRVTRIDPVPGATVKTLDTIKVWFSESVQGLDFSDLLLNGVPAVSVSGSGSGPYTFTFPSDPTGMVVVSWANNHGITDLARTLNAFAGGSWNYIVNPELLRHVVHISVDGGGAMWLRDYVKNGPQNFPNFVRLQNIAAWTFNARCDYDISVTLPNHSCMFTGRPALQPPGWDNTTHHGLTIDQDNGSTIHSPNTGNPNVPYKYSVFDVVHDNGLSTAFLYSKASLTLLVRSWSSTNGAVDLVGEDNGRNKIDYVLSTAGGAATGSSLPIVQLFEGRVSSNALWNYTFIHFTEPDTVGHSSGWGSTTWSNTMMTIDTYIGRIVDAILTSPTYSNDTVLIITADHGGTGLGHSDAANIYNYTIPMFIMGPKIPAGADLYSLFANRVDPGTNRISYTAQFQPLRDGDVGNLVCTFLGLPQIPGSSLMPVFGTPPVWLSVVRTTSGLSVSWPVTAEGYLLQYTKTLTPPMWLTITDGISTNGSVKSFLFTDYMDFESGFFRLIKLNNQ